MGPEQMGAEAVEQLFKLRRYRAAKMAGTPAAPKLPRAGLATDGVEKAGGLVLGGLLEKLARVLTDNARAKVKKRGMGLPGNAEKGRGAVVGSYPMPDRRHAAVAKSFAKRNLDRGRLTQAEYDRIVAKADRKLAGG